MRQKKQASPLPFRCKSGSLDGLCIQRATERRKKQRKIRASSPDSNQNQPPGGKIRLSFHGSRLPCCHGTSGENISPENAFFFPPLRRVRGIALPFPPFLTSRLSSGPGLRRPAGGRGPFPGLRQGAGYVRHGRKHRRGFSRAP